MMSDADKIRDLELRVMQLESLVRKLRRDTILLQRVSGRRSE